jgi:putative methylase|tara:strand:- start:98 stop:733 length:636 start_codon:yes stop_codon:yes gene_type:complete
MAIGNVSKGELGVILSRLRVFDKAKVRVEQYPMDSEIAAQMLWEAHLRGEIDGKIIVDLGCGTGILGIGALILGARMVFFIDNDNKAIDIAKINLENVKSEGSIGGKVNFLVQDIKEFSGRGDVVIQNPPFGVQTRGNDRAFLNKAMETAPVVYSFHKSESNKFIKAFSAEKGYVVRGYWEFDFPIKATQKFHTKKIYRFKVGCWRLEKEG